MKKKTKVFGTKAGKAFVHLISGSTEFLKSISVKPTGTTEGNVRLMDMQRHGLKIMSRYNQVSFGYDQGFNIPYSCKEIVYPTILSDSDLEDMGIDPDNMENMDGEGGIAIAVMLAKIYGLDFQDLALNGDIDLDEVADPSTPAEHRQNMLRQMDGYLNKLDDAGRIIKDASHDTIKKEIAVLYETYSGDDLITTSTRIWMSHSDYVQAWQAVNDTSKDLMIRDNMLYYISTPIISVSNMSHLLIGDPEAMQIRIQTNPTLENARSIDHRGFKCLLGMKADSIFVIEIFRGLEHTAE